MTFRPAFGAATGEADHSHEGGDVSGTMPFVDTVNGVKVAAHASRHATDGVDPISLTELGFPTGAILMWPTDTAPTGWLLLDGSEVSQTTYADLYALIGTTFNTGGESAGNFRLPDIGNRFPMGAGVGGVAAGATGGAASTFLIEAQLPSHTHTLAAHGHGLTGSVSSGSHSHGDTFSTGNQSANHSHNSGTLVVDAFFSTAADAQVGGGAERMRTASPSQGANVGGSTGTQSASHSHAISGSVSSSSHSHGDTFAVSSAGTAGSTGSVGSGNPIDNRPPYLALYFIVKT